MIDRPHRNLGTTNGLPLVAIRLCILLCVQGAPAAAAENIDPDVDDHQYAWGENVGWINAEPAGNGGPGVEVHDFQLVGWMWGENIGWISLTCANTFSCSATNYGVVNDGFGRLSGFARSENAGWMNFDPVTCEPNPTCGVRIDTVTGYFSGRAWGENIGWITFSDGTPTASTVRTSWCHSTVAPPGAGFVLTLSKLGTDQTLSWSSLAEASWYDVVRGRLSTLQATGGDFAVSTEQCVVEKLTMTSHVLSGSDPPVGDGSWFLVRGANCKGNGTYDTGAPSQAGPRDFEIDAALNNCP